MLHSTRSLQQLFLPAPPNATVLWRNGLPSFTGTRRRQISYRCLMQPGPRDQPVITPLAPLRSTAAPGRATMRDVAALAGVSLKTVSRVVNGAVTVDAGLAARVRRAAAQ